MTPAAIKRIRQRFRRKHPHYHRDMVRRQRGWMPPGGVLLLGVRCDLRLLQRARCAAEFILLTKEAV
jgi:hypothetical protein